MPDYLFRSLALRDQISSAEQQVLRDAIESRRTLRANEEIVREGDRPVHSILMLEGISCRYNVLTNGGRQITSLHVAGDFIDLHVFLIKTMDHSVRALTPCRIALFPHATLRRITEEYPHLARMLWLLTLVDAAIHRRWMTGIGRQRPLAFVAHIFCEMYMRQREVGLISGNTFAFPLSQTMLADVLGLSTVHTNRVVRELRERELVDWTGSSITVRDLDALKALAEFDPTYLSMWREER